LKILARALARLWIIVVFAAFSTPAGVAVASEGVAAREVVVTSAFNYDGPSIARVDAREMGAAEASPAQLSDMREESVSRSVEERDTSTTPSARSVATNTARPAGPGPRGGDSPAAARGRQAHAEANYGPGFQKEFTLPSGRRVDGINFDTRTVVELKPNNPRAIRAGERQVGGYVDELNTEFPGSTPWTGRVETYDP
jgi:Restriction endonuclease fold toxin 9